MDNQTNPTMSKINENRNFYLLVAISVIFGIYLVFSLPFIFRKPGDKDLNANAKAPSSNSSSTTESYVEVGGKKYSETDLRDAAPNQMKKLRSEYLKGLSRVANEFAFEKALELEAKATGLKKEEVLSKGYKEKEPTPEEIKMVYDQYKEQLGGKKIEEVKPKIVQFLKSEAENTFKRSVIEGLKKKYNVVVKMEDIRLKIDERKNPSMGPANAKITIVEFSDFECPFCQRSQKVNKQIREKYKDKVRWVFRDYPLPNHENAMFAHQAVNCSIKQNKYWEYFDKIFQNTGNLSSESVLKLADQVGLDRTKLMECINIDGAKIRAEIEQDIEDGKELGVTGTPAFFINGVPVEGAQPFEVFESIINKELQN